MKRSTTHQKGKAWIVPEYQMNTFVMHDICYDQLLSDCEKSSLFKNNISKKSSKKSKTFFEIKI